jgi:hypothetical protein
VLITYTLPLDMDYIFSLDPPLSSSLPEYFDCEETVLAWELLWVISFQPLSLVGVSLKESR